MWDVGNIKPVMWKAGSSICGWWGFMGHIVKRSCWRLGTNPVPWINYKLFLQRPNPSSSTFFWCLITVIKALAFECHRLACHKVPVCLCHFIPNLNHFVNRSMHISFISIEIFGLHLKTITPKFDTDDFILTRKQRLGKSC